MHTKFGSLTLTLTSDLIFRFFVSGAYLLYCTYFSSNVSYAGPISLGGIIHITVTFLVIVVFLLFVLVIFPIILSSPFLSAQVSL